MQERRRPARFARGEGWKGTRGPGWRNGAGGNKSSADQPCGLRAKRNVQNCRKRAGTSTAQAACRSSQRQKLVPAHGRLVFGHCLGGLWAPRSTQRRSFPAVSLLERIFSTGCKTVHAGPVPCHFAIPRPIERVFLVPGDLTWIRALFEARASRGHDGNFRLAAGLR